MRAALPSSKSRAPIMKKRPKAINIKPAQKSFGLLIFTIPSASQWMYDARGVRQCDGAHERHGVSQRLIRATRFVAATRIGFLMRGEGYEGG